MSTREIEQLHPLRRGVPVAVWIVAALLWAVSVGAVALLDDDPIVATRAVLFAVASLGVGAIAAALLIAVKRHCGIVLTLTFIVASQIGRNYIVVADPVSAAEAFVVFAGTGAVYAACRALAPRVAH